MHSLALLFLSAFVVASAYDPIVEILGNKEIFQAEKESVAAMSGAGVQLSLQLLSYSNPKGTIYVKPNTNQTYTCLALPSQGTFQPCQYYFQAAINPSTFSSVTLQPAAPVSGVTNISTTNSWKNAMMLSFPMKPATLSVTVMHSGTAFDASMSNNVVGQGLYVADTFTTSLSGVVPFLNNYTPFPSYVNVQVFSAANNSLMLQMSMRCATPGAMGSSCGMTSCTPIGQSAGSCQDAKGNHYACQVAATVPNQYTNCQMCPAGVSGTGTCNAASTVAPSNGPSVAPIPPNNLVASSFKGATIALAIILVIVLIIGIGVIVKCYMNNNSKHHDAESAEYDRRYKNTPPSSTSDSDSTTGSETESSTGTSATTTPASSRKEIRGFNSIPDGPDRAHLNIGQYHPDDSSRNTSRRSSQVSHDPADLQSAHSSLPDGGRTTPRLEARV